MFLLASPSDGDLSNAGVEYKGVHFLKYPFISTLDFQERKVRIRCL